MKRADRGDAVRRKYPELVVFVVTADEAGTPNVMPAGWSTFTSGDPPMIAVSIGLERHTHRNLDASPEFVVAFPSAAQKAAVIFCGSRSGADVDKIADSDLEILPGDEIGVPLLADAAACFECRVDGRLRTGDHTLFAGEILASHVSDRYEERLVQIGKRWEGTDRFRTLSELLSGAVSAPDPAD